MTHLQSVQEELAYIVIRKRCSHFHHLFPYLLRYLIVIYLRQVKNKMQNFLIYALIKWMQSNVSKYVEYMHF